jgi:5'-3' exonuclease
MKRVTARRKEAIEKFGVPPEHVVDYLAIVGDSSDNIPGISGFGPKKAEALITEFGSLESIYENLNAFSGKMRETLEASREIAFLSKRLATIDVEVPTDFELESAKFHADDFFTSAAKDFFRRLGFKSLLPKEETVLKDFDTLALAYEEVTERSELERLTSAVSASKKITFAAFEEGGRFAGCAIGLDGKYFLLRARTLPLGTFLKTLLDAPIEIIGFDSKPDVRAVLRYLENSETSAIEAQATLF